ncbi:MAG TPA: hypothetical protein VG984_02440 [Candidatus Paceibacterota bacterium]|nr:hypothetical protein [Candidatus Paceibacterota bacterium]
METLKAPAHLLPSILARIEELRQRRARLYTFVLGLASLATGAALVPAWNYASQELYTSGFFDYWSLLFSDHSVVLSAWREFALLLIESLPSIALLLLFGLGALFVWSLSRTVFNAKILFTNRHA